jgi:thioredoxin 2
MTEQLTKETFLEKIFNYEQSQEWKYEGDLPAIIDFWADWCGPCRMAAPELEKVAQEMAGQAIVLKVNTEEQPELAAKFEIQSIPNFVILRRGNLVMQQAGLVDHKRMRNWIEQTRFSEP